MITKKPVYRVLTCIVLLIVMLRLSRIGNLAAIFDFGYRYSVKDLNVWEWYHNNTVYCGGNYTQFGHRFMKINHAYFDLSLGEQFAIQCKGKRLPTNEWFYGYNHAPERFTKTLSHIDLDSFGEVELWNNTIIVVHRDYPNTFHHAMIQWFNIFIISKFLQFDFRNADIMFLDKGPAVHLDVQWFELFGKVIKMKYLYTPFIFKEAIFSIPGHESPMHYMEQNRLQYVEEFSKIYLESFGLKSNKRLDCSALNIALGIRKDYYVHPRMKRNSTESKLKNEIEILRTVQDEFKGHSVIPFSAEETSLNEQLNIMTEADIFISMHGCLMTHIMFMPRHGAVFEMHPKQLAPQPFFKAIARWRGLKYEFWRNKDYLNVSQDHHTYIPSDVLTNYTRRIKVQMCT